MFKKRIISLVLCIFVLIGLLAACGEKAPQINVESSPRETAPAEETTPSPSPEVSPEATPELTPEPQRTLTPEILAMVEHFWEVQKKYPDIVAWIKIDNTNIDYPVFQGENNKRYLDKDRDNKKSNAGEIFMDHRIDANDLEKFPHWIFYGHNMRKAGTMFNQLMLLKKEDFYDKNKTIRIVTFDGYSEWEMFNTFITKTTFNYIQTNFKSLKDYTKLMAECVSKGQYPTDVAIGEKDKVLTLSTCTYEYDDARYVVQAKLNPSSRVEIGNPAAKPKEG